MIEFPSVLPVAAMIGLATFFARELFEFVRRFKANSRKIEAIRRLVKAECERNNYSIQSMIQQVNNIKFWIPQGGIISIVKNHRSEPRLEIRYPEGELATSSPIRHIHTAILEKYLFEMASLDRFIFDEMEKMMDTLAEAKHIREGIIEYVSEDQTHLDGFVDHYAPTELDKTLEIIQDCYLAITGEPLAKKRIR